MSTSMKILSLYLITVVIGIMTVVLIGKEPDLFETPADLGISSNPGAVNIWNGTGQLGRYLGFHKHSGVRIGGTLIGDANYLLAGGVKPKTWSENGLLILSLNLDVGEFSMWKGALFDIEFLQFNGAPTNVEAGTIQEYNNLPGPPPLNRSELYQLWYRQELFNNKLIIRIGKQIPTYDFNNVLRPIHTLDISVVLPSVSSLIYTPIVVNPTLLGVIPGYYNSAYGITATFAPDKSIYFSYGHYDGNLARGEQTGLRGPQFNGYYFYIGETGYAWESGQYDMPGIVAIGAWNQTGKLSAFNLTEKGTQGLYMFGSQCLWLKNPEIDSSWISGFFQFGINNSKTLFMNKFFGLGLTAFGLTPCSPKDSMGIGMAWSWLNQKIFDRTSELMFQGYYQAHLFGHTYFEPVISYIPTPGASKDLAQTWAVTGRLIALF